MPFRVAYVPAHLPSYETVEHSVVARSASTLRARVERAGGVMVDADEPVISARDAQRHAATLRPQDIDLVVLQSSSFAMGDVVAPFAQLGAPLCLWAPDEPRRHGPIPLNGFVAMHLHAGILATDEALRRTRYTWLFGDEGNPLFEDRIDVLLTGVRVAHALRHARVERLGDVAPTFYSVAADPGAVDRNVGATVRHAPLEPLFTRVRDIVAAPEDSDDEVRLMAAATAVRDASVAVEVDEEDLLRNVAVYLALEERVRQGELNAIALRDWPEFQSELGLHPGLACSWLDHHDGIPVAAEADVGGALSMLAARAASNEPAMLLDVNDVDVDRDALLTWHCGGSPLAIADEHGVRWTPHTTLGRGDARKVGTVADLTFEPGPVTLVRVGRDGERWFVVEGEVVTSPHAGFDGSRGWISTFSGPDGPLGAVDVVETLIMQGVEHHLALVPGHHGAALRSAAWCCGATLVPFTNYRAEPGTIKPPT